MIQHVWQSTVFALFIGLLALALRKYGAHVRHWLWFSASIKFLLPLALLSTFGESVGESMEWTPPRRIAASPVPAAIEQLAFPEFLEAPLQKESDWAAPLVWTLWTCGALAVATMRFRDWRRVRDFVRAATPLDLRLRVPVRSAPGLLEPGVFGIRKPVLLLPAGIEQQLTAAQLEAVVAHELAHVRRRDNLLSSVHMLVEALFWFHPLVWWIGARLIEERERACDEAVLSRGGEPRAYAEGILNVRKLYTESPVACVAGVSGANLRQRIEAIMTNAALARLSGPVKAALGAAACAGVLLPVGLGLLRAQDLAFEVAAIKPADDEIREVVINGRTRTTVRIPEASGGPGTATPGQITYRNQTLLNLMMTAYGLVRADQVEFPEGFDASRAYDMVVGVPEGATQEQVPVMLRSLLRERFGLRFHTEQRARDVYVVKMAGSGPKFKASAPPPEPSEAKGTVGGPDDDGYPVLPPHYSGIVMRPGGAGVLLLSGQRVSAGSLLRSQEFYLGRQVVDETGLTGAYDFRFRFAMRGLQPAGDLAPADPVPTAREALEELGFRFESAKRAVEVFVIDAVNQEPTEN